MTRLEIISDPICPWCYIGVTKLMRAIEARPDYTFGISWRPYQLNPGMAFEGMDRREYLIDKFGGAENAVKVYGQIEDAARDSGLNIDFKGIRRTPNTLDALRLIHWATTEGKQTPVAMALFRAYFVDGLDIGDHTDLVKIAGNCGLDTDTIARLLDSDTDRKDIHNESLAARDMGVTGVPAFILGGKYVLSGAQPVETWTKLIDELSEALKAMGPV